MPAKVDKSGPKVLDTDFGSTEQCYSGIVLRNVLT